MLVVLVVLVCCPPPCHAQADDAEDRPRLRDRLRVSGEASASVSTMDAERDGWFNYSDYGHSTVRTLRLALAGEFRAHPRLSFLAELRTTQMGRPEAYAMYVRVRPFLRHDLDIHLGRIPPTFGAFPRRLYATDNPLVGLPLGFQYLTSLRADALPQSPDELASMRGEGWLAFYTAGTRAPGPGQPLVNALRWDTGVQVRWLRGPFTALGAVTQGTLGDPRLSADNGAAQVASRFVYAPHPVVTLGVSGASGPYLQEAVIAPLLPPGASMRRYRQDAVGADVEVSRDRWLIRAEGVRSAWGQPVLSGASDRRVLGATAGMVEGRYALGPGLYVAARVDRLDFSRIASTGGMVTWDAPVSRLEAGVGWTIRRHLLVKAAWQRNRRDGGVVRASDLGLMQVVAWF